MNRKGKGRDRNSSSWWGDDANWWQPKDFIPAWIPLEQINSKMFIPFDSEISSGQFQKYLPLYVNNDGYKDGVNVLVLELEESNSSVGFSQEIYVLREVWDSVPGDAWEQNTDYMSYPESTSISGESEFSRSVVIEAQRRMFLVDETNQLINTPKLVYGGRFKEAIIVIEDAQSTVPPIKLDDSNNVYAVPIKTITHTTEINGELRTFSRTEFEADVIYAGDGNDQILIPNYDVGELAVFGEAGDDLLRGVGRSSALLNGGSGNDILSGGNILDGMAGDDILSMGGGLTGGSGNDLLFQGRERMFGGDGIDFLSGSGTLYYLEGGAGADRFELYDPPQSLTLTGITDFEITEDKIGIYVGTALPSIFRGAGLTVNAPISANQFHLGTAAADRDDRFIYDKETGELYFDADGTGSKPQTPIFSRVSSEALGGRMSSLASGTPAGLNHTHIVTFDDSNRLPPPSQPLPAIPSVQFSQSTYEVSEDAGTATLTLSRTGDVRGRSQVQVSVTGGTATATDYESNFPLTVTFGISEASKTIDIPIIQNTVVEETESIIFSIMSVNDPAAGTVETTMESVRTATLSIQDDDISPSPTDNRTDEKIIEDEVTKQTTNQITDKPGVRIVTGNRNDILRGGEGDDLLISGKGNDRLFGGKGKDIFALGRGRGRDIIQDFENQQDRLGLIAGLQYKRLIVIQQGKNTLISLGKDELALLKGIRTSQLSAADFTAFNAAIPWS
ncbi:hypothetical protein H6F87_03805 [Cyanobacteria bacterium FACHB-502]|nr:hypothetical protein [Cyanobacteria bacterium FACHB-502]